MSDRRFIGTDEDWDYGRALANGGLDLISSASRKQITSHSTHLRAKPPLARIHLVINSLSSGLISVMFFRAGFQTLGELWITKEVFND